jgi:hypothetical protein
VSTQIFNKSDDTTAPENQWKQTAPTSRTTGQSSQPEGGDSEKGRFDGVVPEYALLFFDHLYSEYLTLKSKIEDQQVIAIMEEIGKKREFCRLTWANIYTFDLALVDVRPLESLIRKAYDARAKYRSIAGQKEYDEYLASKPPDLTTILISPAIASPKSAAHPDKPTDSTSKLDVNPDTTGVATADERPISPDAEIPKSLMLVQRVLRADIKYLLSKFYLYYSMLPVREGLRDELTNRAVRRTLLFVGVLAIFIVVNLGSVFIFQSVGDSSAGLTVLTVALAGIMGGCVSMLQRIQSAPSEGDALFNLAALNNGWRGLSLSPLYGGIFASLLFVLFAAGVLKGSVFPVINTSKMQQVAQPAPVRSATTSPTDSTTPAPPAIQVNQQPTPNPTPDILRIKSFLKETGPADGVAYALLIIWSFLAGFAERLVPDTLNRLVAKNEALQGTNA